MASDHLLLSHRVVGGWARDFGSMIQATIDASGFVEVPFLLDAENVLYRLDGGLVKSFGTQKLVEIDPAFVSGGVLDSFNLDTDFLGIGSEIKGLFDYWRTGTGGTSTQHRIIYEGGRISKDDADGVFDTIFGGLSVDAVPSFAVLEDILVIATDVAGEVPKSWDGTTPQDLAGSPPDFAFVETHKNRMWAAGVDANSSRLYYSALLNAEDWTGSGSGSIDIDPRDGDRITAIASHRNELFIFKGPNKGSIHRISGSAPTGADGFGRTTFARGVGAVGHNTVFRFGDDLGFIWSDGTVRSLAVTEKFGDYIEVSLSRPINAGFLDTRVNLGRLQHAWADTDSLNGVVLITLAIDTSTTNNAVLVMDYRFSPVRWSLLPDIAAGSLARIIDPTDNDRHIIMFGGVDGFIRKWGRSIRTEDGNSIASKVTFPILVYGSAFYVRTLNVVGLGFETINDSDVVFSWTRDNRVSQNQTITQGGTGIALDSFRLDQDTLGVVGLTHRFAPLEEGGEFRAIQYKITHNVNNNDMDLRAFVVDISGASYSTEN